MQITNTNFVNITFSDNLPNPVTPPVSLNYLLVGGGGGGGAANGGGGGGAGGLMTGSYAYSASAGNIVIAVGAGGASQVIANQSGGNGSLSNIYTTLATIPAYGGGGGGGGDSVPLMDGNVGGSGGGGASAGSVNGNVGNIIPYIYDSSSANSNIKITSVGITTYTANTALNSGGSFVFNGINNYLVVSSDNSLAFGTGDLTVECWIYPTSTTQFEVIYLTNSFQFFTFGGALYMYDNGSQTSGGTISLNTWQHIAVTRSGTTLRCFINGVVVNTQVSSTNFISGTNWIGWNGGTYAKGYLTNFRIIKGTARYTSAFTVPTSPLTAITNTSLLVTMQTQGNVGGMAATDGSTYRTGGGGGGAGAIGQNAFAFQGGAGGTGAKNSIITTTQASSAQVGEVVVDGTGAFTYSYSPTQQSAGGARTTPVIEGSYYFEVLLTTLSPNEVLFGLCRSTSAGGFNNVPSIYSLTGVGYGGMSGGASLGAFANGDVLQVAYNSNTNKVWIGKNASWYLDPVSSAGSDIPGIGLLRFIMMSGASAGAGAIGVFRRSTQNTYTAPTGFSALTVNNSIPVASKSYLLEGWSTNTDYNPINGANVIYFAGGGGGAGWSTGVNGPGGFGGGGQGANGSAIYNSFPGTINTGGGGGGAYSGASGNAGGSGVVILSHPSSNLVATFSIGSPNIFITAGNVIYVFKQSGYLSWAPPTIEYLIVGGGAGGGGGFSTNARGGGGGSGAVVNGVANVVLSTNITVIIGAGGAGGVGGSANPGTNGGNSNIFSTTTITALGGGGGGCWDTYMGNVGGSGGGGGQRGSQIGTGNISIQASTFGYGIGFAGGNATTYNGLAGAGGGGGGTGENGYNAFTGMGGNGGNGTLLYSGILYAANAGTNVNGTYYIAAGGGGAGGYYAGSPGLGGNGFGAYLVETGFAANTNTGSGGGGGGGLGGTSAVGGAGGSGLVILRYPDKYADPISNTGSPNVYVTGGYKYYKFLQSGSIKF